MPLVIRSFLDLNSRTLSNALANSLVLVSWRPSRGNVDSIADSCPWLMNSSFEPQHSYIHISLYISTHVCVYVTVCFVSQVCEAPSFSQVSYSPRYVRPLLPQNVVLYCPLEGVCQGSPPPAGPKHGVALAAGGGGPGSRA